MVVIHTEIYEEICKFCADFRGLTIDCEQQLQQTFRCIDARVLSAILSKQWQKHIKNRHHIIVRAGPNLLKEYVVN